MVEGAPPLARGDVNDANHRVVTPDYFKTLRVPLVAGRFFDARDSAGAPPVAIVNETMAKQFWPGQNPLGRRFRSDGRADAPWFTIVGVVGGIRQTELDAASRAEAYYCALQPEGSAGYFMPRDLAVRVHGDPLQSRRRCGRRSGRWTATNRWRTCGRSKPSSTRN